MSERRRSGMDLDHYPYSPLPQRPRLGWPGGEPVAFWLVVYLEYWELDPPPDAVRDRRLDGELGSYFPDYRNYSLREYGNRVGLFRIFEVLDRYGLKATVAANAEACRRYPYLVEQCRRRGWELAAHGTHATRMLSSAMSDDEERAAIAESVAAVESACGARPTGWIGQDFGESVRTPRFLAEADLGWLADWPNDEQPYRMSVDPPLVSIPYQAEWDDVQLLQLRRLPTPRYPDVVLDAFTTLHEEGAVSGRTFGLGIHPWLLGQPHRIRYLDEALARITELGGAWQATAGEIAAHFLASADAD